MTPTQIARRSDALYADGTCGMTRRVLCDMVAQRESDLEDARAENAKLRQHLADVTVSIGRVEERCAKLRELLDYVTPIAWYAASERERDRMRKLGVEVTS